MKILFHELGISGYTLFAQIINFLLLLFILRRFLYAPLLTFMDKRKGIIEEGLQNADKAKEELSKIYKIKEEKITEARREADKIIEKSKMTAESQGATIAKEAVKKSENIIQEAKKIAEEEKRAAAFDLKKDIANLVALTSLHFAEKNITEKDNERIINKYLELLQNEV